MTLSEASEEERASRQADGSQEISPKGDNNGVVMDAGGPENRPASRPELRKKQRHSSYVFFAFMSLGMVVALHGPTFLDLLLILNVDLKKGTVLFTSGSIGYLLGSLIGGIIYDRFNKEMLLLVSTAMMGLSTVVLPFTRFLPAMACVNCFRSCVMGGLDTGGNAMMVRIWGKDVGPYMQAVHFAFGFGGILSPFIAEPFLLSKPDVPSNGSLPLTTPAGDFLESTSPASGTINQGLYNTSQISRPENTSGNLTQLADIASETQVHVPYLIIGFIAVLSSLPFIEMFLTKRAEKGREAENKTGDATKEIRHIPLTNVMKVTFLVLMGLFYIFYCCVEDTFSGFLMTFVVTHLKWSKTKGARITSVFWIAFSVGRLFAIVISKYLTPWKMLVIDFSLLVVSFLALLLGVEHSEAFCWACTVVIAIAMASIFPTGMTWMDRRIMKITGKVASFLLVCASGGTMANPILVGYLFESYTPMWFVYLLFAQTLVCALNFAVTSVLVVWVHNKWKSRKSRAGDDQGDSAVKDDALVHQQSENTSL